MKISKTHKLAIEPFKTAPLTNRIRRRDILSSYSVLIDGQEILLTKYIDTVYKNGYCAWDGHAGTTPKWAYKVGDNFGKHYATRAAALESALRKVTKQ